jgi:S1-C subfamily serine protease
MKIALILVASFWIFAVSANAQNVLTRKEIYRANCKAIVQVYVNGKFSGVGFIASNDGAVITANHVVATRESNFRQYAGGITVLVDGNPTPYPATPLSAQVSDDQVSSDSAILKIDASKLPHVTLGTLDDIDVSDTVTIIPSWPGIGCIMLEGIVANKASIRILGPKPVNIVLFQAPIRNGFSGSPIFSSKGHVVGIEDTKVFGISPGLDSLRKEWTASRSLGSVAIMGIDLSASFLELINNLDQNLISGLGSGVAIEYAKKQREAAKEPTTQH